MTTLLSDFRSAINAVTLPHPTDASLEIQRSGVLSACYAPFDHINPTARVVLLGMTPGAQQAGIALQALRAALARDESDEAALAKAKHTASFSGPMRKNLVAMLDRVGLHKILGLDTCEQLFTTHTHLVHFTSALRYPVFVDGRDYSGSPAILATPFLAAMCDRWLAEEISQLADAFWIPLGKEAKSVLSHFAAQGCLDRKHILEGIPHPSGANAERIAYFLGRKSRQSLSAKTNPDQIDTAREKLTAAIARPGTTPPTIRMKVSPPTPVSAPTTSTSPTAVTKAKTSTRDRRADRFAKTFVLLDPQGNPRFPMRAANGAFVLSLRGVNMHHAEHAIHVADEEKAYQMVASGTYKIRAVRGTGDPANLLGVGDRAISKVVRRDGHDIP